MLCYFYAREFSTFPACAARKKHTFFSQIRFKKIILTCDESLLTKVLSFYLYADM